MVGCYDHVIESIECVRGLLGGSTDTSFRLNECQCQILGEELEKTRIFLVEKSVSSKLSNGVGRICLVQLCSTIKRVEVFVKKCCCKDAESWLLTAMMLVEMQEEFMANILDIYMWRRLLDFAIASARGLSMEKKAEEMMIIDEEYHELFKELRTDRHSLQEAAVEDKRTVISRISSLLEDRASCNDLDNQRAMYLQSWLTSSCAACGDAGLNNYEIVHILGQGGCGFVLKVKWLGVECALKFLRGRDNKEATALKGLYHPNIIRLFHYWEDPPENPKSHLVMEVMPEDLAVYMKSRKKSSASKSQVGKDDMPFSLPVAIDVMYQIAQAMRYMHGKHMVHRDLKPANILVRERARMGLTCSDGGGYLDIKLADFGLVKPYESTSVFQTHSQGKGTKNYRAPEVYGKDTLKKRNCLPMVDVWSFGITCAEILSGKDAYFEYKDESPLTLHSMICKKGLRPALPKHCPEYLTFCITSCWEFLPTRRPNFASICKLLRHAKLLSLGVTSLDDSKVFFAYATQSGHQRSLRSLSSSSPLRARFPTFFQSPLKIMGLAVRSTPNIAAGLPAAIQQEVQSVPTPAFNEVSDEVAAGRIGSPESFESPTAQGGPFPLVENKVLDGPRSDFDGFVAAGDDEEFKVILTMHSKPADRARLMETLPIPWKHVPETSESGGGDVMEQLLTSTPHNEKALNPPVLPGMISPEVVQHLHEMAQRLVSADNHQQYLKIYREVRASSLEQSLLNLGVKRLSNVTVMNMSWESLYSMCTDWIKYVPIAIKVLFSTERKLCDQIWVGVDPHREKCFADVTDSSFHMLLGFGEALTKCRIQPQRLFSLLDMYEMMRELQPEIEQVLSGDAATGMRETATGLIRKLGQTAKDTFAGFEDAVDKDANKIMILDGTVHRLTDYVLNYFKYLLDYQDTLNELLSVGSVDDKTSHLASATKRIMNALQTNLEVKAKLYKNPALAHIFLMNNIHHMVTSVRRSEGKDMLGDDWMQIQHRVVQQHLFLYQRNAWTKVLQYITGFIGTSSRDSGTSKTLLKERFKGFNMTLDELYLCQTQWEIPYLELREAVRLQVQQIILPAYRAFVGRYGHWMESDQMIKYLKYTPGDVERMVNDLFEGKLHNKGE